MLSELNLAIIVISLEGFFYGLYAGIFAVYLHCVSSKSRTTTKHFYTLLFLFVLSTIDFVTDLLVLILLPDLEMSFSIQIDVQAMSFGLTSIQTIASGSCNFLAQGILIHRRCLIVWDQNTHVVTIPLILAITCLAFWFAQIGPPSSEMVIPVTLISFALSMAVNALVTGLIVFRILKVFWQIKPTSVERSLASTRGTTLRRVVFVLIESGTALFVIQLIRAVLALLPTRLEQGINSPNFVIVDGINEMFNGITPTIILLRVSLKLSFEDKESFMEAAESICFNHNPPTDLDISLPMGDSTIMSPLDSERNEDINLNDIDPPSDHDPNTLRRLGMGSSSSATTGTGEEYYYRSLRKIRS